MDFEEIIHTAIQIEKEGLEFYTKSAKEVANPNGKGTLEFLAREEARHMAFFEALHEKHGKGGSAPFRVLEVPRIFPKPREFTGKEETTVDQEILMHAKIAEQRSIDFYSGALDGTESAELRHGLELIIKEEKQHLEWVEYLITGLETHEYWGDLQDHFSLDGG